MSCGPTKRLAREVVQTSLAATAAEPRVASLTVLRGPCAGMTLRLPKGRHVIGREDGCWLRLDEDGISRAHLELVVTGQEARARDLGSTNGTFCNATPLTDRPLQDGDQLQLGETTCIKFEHKSASEVALLEQQYDAATRDPLTGCFNRKYFLERLDAELEFAKRHNQPLVVAMLDLDHFKKINDHHGHAAGDLVLTKVASTLGVLLRAGDVLCRYGGEEFLVLLRETDVAKGLLASERLRRGVEHLDVSHGGTSLKVTLSVGLAGFCGASPVPTAELLQRADQALYGAKEAGRNRVVATAGDVANAT